MAGLLAQFAGQVEGRRFADERLAAARRAVEQEALRLGVVKAVEEVRMQQWQLDGVFDCLNGAGLSADPRPRQFGNGLEVEFLFLRRGEQFDGHTKRRIDADFVANLQFRAEQVAGALEDDRVQPVLLAHAKPAIFQDIGDLADGAGVVVPEVADDDVGFVHQHAGADFQGRRVESWIDVGIVIVTTDRDVGDVFLREPEQRADAVGGRSHLLDDLVHLFEGGTGFRQCQLMFLDLLPQAKQIEASGIAFGQGRQQFVDQPDGSGVIASAPFVRKIQRPSRRGRLLIA